MVFSLYLNKFIALILRELEETFKVLILKQIKLRVKKNAQDAKSYISTSLNILPTHFMDAGKILGMTI